MWLQKRAVWLRPLSIPAPSRTYHQHDSRSWISSCDCLISTPLLKPFVFWGPCHAQFISRSDLSGLSFQVSCFHFPVLMTGTNHADDLMVFQDIRNDLAFLFASQRLMNWYYYIIEAVFILNAAEGPSTALQVDGSYLLICPLIRIHTNILWVLLRHVAHSFCPNPSSCLCLIVLIKKKKCNIYSLVVQ